MAPEKIYAARAWRPGRGPTPVEKIPGKKPGILLKQPLETFLKGTLEEYRRGGSARAGTGG